MIKKIIFFIIFVVTSGVLFADTKIAIPEHDTVLELYASENLNYSSQDRVTLIGSINRKIIEILRDFFRRLSSHDGFDLKEVYLIIIAVIIVLAVLFLLYKILKGVWFFYSPEKKVNAQISDIGLEVKQNTNYLHLYENALNNEDPDTAIRYLYLHALKDLSDKNMIHLRKDKTNKIYTSEIKNIKTKNIFIKIANIFNSVYYGKNSASVKLALDVKKLCDLLTEAE